MKRPALLILASFFLFACTNEQPETVGKRHPVSHKRDSLTAKLNHLLADKKADVGIAVLSLENGDTISINGNSQYSLMSVAKLPQALLLLHLVDDGKISMEQPVHFNSTDLEKRTGSSFRKDHPGATVDIQIPEMLKYSIGQSDNITAIRMFELEGGPAAVNDYVRRLGINDMRIMTDYAHLGEDSMHRNSASPWAVVQLLEKFYRGEIISNSNRALLWKVMVEGPSGANRLKGGLPAGTIVAHKTGTSATDSATGITPAFNDAGIVQLPNGKHFAIVVFVAQSKERDTANAAIIADVCKAVWEYYLSRD